MFVFLRGWSQLSGPRVGIRTFQQLRKQQELFFFFPSISSGSLSHILNIRSTEEQSSAMFSTLVRTTCLHTKTHTSFSAPLDFFPCCIPKQKNRVEYKPRNQPCFSFYPMLSAFTAHTYSVSGAKCVNGKLVQAKSTNMQLFVYQFKSKLSPSNSLFHLTF